MHVAAQQFSDGAMYERLMGRWSRKIGVQFLEWCAVPAGKAWLDVGCGNAAFTQEIVVHCAPAKVLGVDPSPGQIAYAQKRDGIGEATFQVGDAMTLPVADASFDAVTMALVISFVPDPAKAVAELHRVTRPGGLSGAYMWDFEGGGVPLSPFIAAMRALDFEVPMPPHPEVATRLALEALWRGAGFKNVETTVLRITVEFANFDEFWEINTLPSGPQAARLAALNPAQKAELKERLRAVFRTEPDGRITYQSFANAVKGRA